jgi:hypothetical protein
MKKHVSKEEWVAMYREIGLDDSKMDQWHRLFESRHPDGHQGFLEWLGMPLKEVDRVRVQSR